MVRLGLWQLHRAESPTGGIQNYAYALQWPLFAAFAVFLWVRTLVEEVRRDPDAERPGAQPEHEAVPRPEIVRQPGVRVGISARSVPVDENDDEMHAYNARLAAMNARAAATESRRR
jgi:DNA-binding transcriptional regulator of glucitol operon